MERADGRSARNLDVPLLIAAVVFAFAVSSHQVVESQMITKPQPLQTQTLQPLTLGGTARVQVISARPGPREQHSEIEAPPIRPSSRARLFKAVQMGETGTSDVQPLPTGLPGQMERLLSLREAYQYGITLTTTGCEYRGGRYTGYPPLIWTTARGRMEPEKMVNDRLTVSPGLDGRRGTELLGVWLITPGTVGETGTYILELCTASWDSDYFADLRITVNDQEIEFTPTSDGTRLAIVQLSGCGEGVGGHLMQFVLRRDVINYEFEFLWLNVVMH